MKIQKKFYMKSHMWVKIFCVVFVAVILLMIVLMAVWQHNNIKYLFEREEHNIMENQSYISTALVDAISFSVLSEGVEILPADLLKKAVESVFYYNVGTTALFKGEKLITSTYYKKDEMDYRLLKKNLSEGECFLKYYEASNNTQVIKAVSIVTLQGEDYKVITTTDISYLYTYQKKIIKQMVIICTGGGILSAVVLLIIFKLAFKPLNEINDNVNIIAAGNYDQRLDVKRNDELGQLAYNINEMAQAVGDNIQSLKEAASQQKRFVHNLSHEMKTPLTSIICYSEIMMVNEQIPREKIMNYAGIILTEGKRLKMISEKLMDFLYIGKINECDKTEVSMEAVMDDICAAMAPMFKKKKIQLDRKINDFIMNVDLELFM